MTTAHEHGATTAPVTSQNAVPELAVFELTHRDAPYTVEAPDLEVAVASVLACCVIGSGGDENDDGTIAVSFKATDHNDWLISVLTSDFDDLLNRVFAERTSEAAACLDSFLPGNLEDRNYLQQQLALIDRPAEREAFRQQFNTELRSPNSDLATYAWAMADMARSSRIGSAQETAQ